MSKSAIALFPLLGLLAACSTPQDTDASTATESESDDTQDSGDDTLTDDETTSVTGSDSTHSSGSSSSSHPTDTSTQEETTTLTDESETATDSDSETDSESTTDGETTSSDTDSEGTLHREILRYDLHFSLTSLVLQSALDIKAEAAGACFAAACEPQASDVQWNGMAPVSVTSEDDELLVCGAPLSAGAKFSLAAATQVEKKTYLEDPQGTTLDVGYTEKANLSGATTPYLMSWIGGCKHFGPCDDDPARLADFHYEIEHDEDAIVLCPGKLTPGKTVTRCDLDSSAGMAQAPTYTGFMVISDNAWVRSELTQAAGVDLVLYESASGSIQSAIDTDMLAQYFEWITDLVGPYPYGDELRFAAAPTVWLGLEHPANIVLQENLADVSGAFFDTPMHVIMHETAHQWSGNRTTLASAQDFAWKEATAEYLTYLFEEAYGAAGAADRTREFWEQLALGAKHYPRPLDTPELEPQEFYGDAYGAGPLVMYIQLEALLGRDVVVEALQDFLAKPGSRSVADLQDALEKASGEDLAAYFKAWVFGKGAPTWPTFTVETKENADGSLEVKVTQESEDNVLRGCVVEVDVQTTSGTERVEVSFGSDPKSATATTDVEIDGVVIQTTVDPDHKVLNANSIFLAPLPDPSRFIGY